MMNLPKPIVVLAMISCSLTSFAQTVPQLGKNSVKEVIAAMTLEEKATLVVGASKPPANQSTMAGGAMIGATQAKVPGAAGNTAAIPRLGIPSMVLSDGPAGVRIQPIRNGDSTKTYYATAFPVGTLLASSWDPALVNRVGKAFGNEVLEYGVDILLAPGVNIHRNPLNGRNFEYYSEDPLIAGTMAGAIINGVQSNGVGTSIKHFAANNQETNRTTINTLVSERALREIYLRGFRIAIAASNPWTVMSSYNKINGTYTAERHDLITTVLRDEWHFKGFVMTDWGGGRNWVDEMKAGNDLIEPGRPSQTQAIISAVQHDSLSVKALDENVEHILNIVLQSPSFKHYQYSNKPDLKAHAEISRQAATEGMVLLKNDDHTLPLKGVKVIAAFGNASYNTIAGGTGSGDVNKAYVVSVRQGLDNAGYICDAGLTYDYTTYLKQEKAKAPAGRRAPAPAEFMESEEMINKRSGSTDIALITIGRNAGEGSDRNLQTNYNLTDAEKQQIKKIATAFHHQGKKVVIVLNIGGVIDMNGWQDDADAILLAWQPGLEAGNAIADVLSGKVNPSGKLATTFPVTYTDVPSAKNFPGTPEGKPEQVIYQEGIYVGYRYYDTFNVKPQYEFGYGLSYTNFSISGLKLNTSTMTKNLTAAVSVKNTGGVAGKQVVQIYVSAPAKSIDKPVQELRAFGKTKLLQPGESQVLTFNISVNDLASYHTAQSEWITDAGKYTLKAGASSRDIKQAAVFTVPAPIVTENDHKAFELPVEISELKGK
ncbi:glycosyl hydrolase [Mucilaginibacter sp. PPCGB 2223]|uniref:glycoside hydrolase family 3 C-terminal domain-containing protein n=1 Tax=Mucilaginibacter sp. PPCGB 2223 TaxID=1886027 RepID=UPI000826AD0F|nr:glycoside hydrolase family 3 C-terminal domain-containing protein [Mucilaginibacter sp. PPCGB 2223]OCX52803.1 glycosyl hydrolase [Mucilaginibacter sp. PPCGB 2223]